MDDVDKDFNNLTGKQTPTLWISVAKIKNSYIVETFTYI